MYLNIYILLWKEYIMSIIYDIATKTFTPNTLQNISYNVVVQNLGLCGKDIIVGKKYKMMCTDGVNTIPLGKCLLIIFTPGHYVNDFTNSFIFTFEKNNDSPLLTKSLSGYDVFNTRLNILEHESDDEDDEDEQRHQ